MGLFSKSKNKDEEFKKQLEREALDKMNNDDGFTLPFERTDSIGIGHGSKIVAPNVITAEELMGGEKMPKSSTATTIPTNEDKVEVQSIKMSTGEQKQTSAAFLYKKMTEARKETTNDATVNTPHEKEPVNKKEQVIESKNDQMPETKQTANNMPKVKDNTEKEQSPITENRVNFSAEKTIEPTKESQDKQPTVIEKPFNLNDAIKELKNVAGINGSEKDLQTKSDIKKEDPAVKLTAEKQATAVKESVINTVQQSTVTNDDVNNVIENINNDIEKIKKDQETKNQAEKLRMSLLDRCNAYLDDDDYIPAKLETEKYKLESVESILSDFETRAAKKVMKRLNISVPENIEVISTNTPKSKENLKTNEIAAPENIEKTQVINLDNAKPETTEPEVKHISFGDSPKKSETPDSGTVVFSK